MEKDTKKMIMGILSYIWILFLIPLFVEKEDKAIRAHAKNGIVIFVASFLLGLIVNLIGLVFGWIPVVGAIIGAILSVISWVLWVAGVAAMAYGIYLSVTGKDASSFPVVSTVADNFLKFLD
ncbi:MAG: hypothetical protein IJE00_08540 [Clostridia bacterium]|nr:hypothetical protein [Clostridia bacterium]